MKIKSIRKLDEKQMTVDIEVSGTHTYQLDNGCVSHNTVSQLTNASSGIHPRYSEYYIRTVRNDKKDPLSDFMIKSNIPCEQDVMSPTNWVFSFPQKSPSHAVLSENMNALAQLEHYKVFNEHWAEHSVSITVYVREHEWLEVGAWVYKNFDSVNGISFLPHTEHSYQQAPYQPITKQVYDDLSSTFPKIDWNDFNVSEHEDNGKGAQQLACVSGVCEI